MTEKLRSVCTCEFAMDQRHLPPDDPQRAELHDEVHTRPPARIRVPAFVTYVAVMNEGVSRESEWEHLRRLPGQAELPRESLQGNFARLRLGDHTLKWERHTEFTSYALVQALPKPTLLTLLEDELPPVAVGADWLAQIPGRTMAAIQLAIVEGSLEDPHGALAYGRTWFGGHEVVASLMGGGHSCVVTDFFRRDNGFERMLVIAPSGTTPTRAGRITGRLLELEMYRLMALRGLPVAKALGPMLGEAERQLAEITQLLEDQGQTERELLDRLTALAARVERATAENGYRFSATAAYDAIMRQRIAELRERPIAGTQTISEYMQRRLSPAIATVASTAQRLASLSQRIERAGALLRTRVDIATESQNQQLLAKLTRGQELQLQLQSTVEGLSIAAISYYVVTLLLYGAKALQKAGVPINPELVAGLSIPVVLWAAWRTVRKIHERLVR
jgi:uncharacterized membrane-anchored protein